VIEETGSIKRLPQFLGSTTTMFLPHVKAEAAASPELPFPYPTLYRFGSAAYDDTDVIPFLPPASRTVRRRSSKGNISLPTCKTRDSYMIIYSL